MAKQKITIRPLKKEEVVAVSNIICAGYRWLAEAEGYSPEELRRLIAERGSLEAIKAQCEKYRFFVAAVQGEIVGALAIDKNEIAKLYVNPDCHGGGIGTALFKFAEKQIADEEYEEMTLRSFPSSAKFYEAMGMQLVVESMSTRGPLKGRKFLVYHKSLRRSLMSKL